jgi:hypothetical protein
MIDLQKSLSSLRNLKALSRKFPLGAAAQMYPRSPLKSVPGVGSNPGNLKMLMYLPPHPADREALVVVLHGCGQTAAGYDNGAGWSTLADRYGFSLLMPEQQRTNNPKGCFNSSDDRDDGSRSRHRSSTRVYHRSLRRRRYDICHAGLLSRGIRRGCGCSRPALRDRGECSASAGGHAAMPDAGTRGMGGRRVWRQSRISRTVAASFGLAWQR